MKFNLCWITCVCGNSFKALVDAFGVYYCDICEKHRQMEDD